jgi:hypothetical protein
MRRLGPALAALALASPALAGDGLYVLAINGGGDRTDNFASHLEHLRQLVQLLSSTGIPRDHITVLSSDGDDPAPDLATREPDPPNAWLLQGTRLDPALRDLTSYQNSVLPGIDLRPATRASLDKTMGELRARLRGGDTLLVYVTDHGSEDRRDPLGNRITLWGPRESISVRRLGALLARLPGGVRVVSLMSQCYSGGFAYLHEARERSNLPDGRTCGYFSSTPDRPAYGCYPEARGQEGIGHSFEFLTALGRRGRFPSAQADVMVSDQTPDIPLRSSDVYLAEAMARAAGSPEREARFVAPFLAQALADPGFADTVRLLDRIASVYGVGKPVSLQDLEAQADSLFALLEEVEAHAKTWEAALGDFNQANLDGFLAAHPAWRARLDERALRGLEGQARRALATSLLAELDAYVGSDPARLAEANRLLTALDTNDEISYRTEIRVAALLRMRFLFTTAAGRIWARGQKEEGKALASLDRCEDLALPALPPPPQVVESSPSRQLPTVADDRRRAAGASPGWLGVTFVPVSPGRRKKLGLPDGAAQVTAVAPRSPAAGAGLRAGDIVVGTPGYPFAHKNDLRPFIVSASPGTDLSIEAARGKSRVVTRVTVGPAPAPGPRRPTGYIW